MTPPCIDALQDANWSGDIFRQMRAGHVDAVHVTITYHETFRETVLNIEAWMPGRFRGNRDFGNLAEGLRATGLSEAEVAGIMGGNWARFFADSFGSAEHYREAAQ